jgi:hypothetical protein
MTQRDAMKTILAMTPDQREAVAVWLETQDDNCIEGSAEQSRLAGVMRRGFAVVGENGLVAVGPIQSGTPVYRIDGQKVGDIISPAPDSNAVLIRSDVLS